MGKPTKPVLEVKVFTKEILDDPVKKVETELKQRGNEIRYQEELREYQEREKKYQENRVRAFALILNDYCSKVMQSQVEEKSDYKTEVRDKPVELMLRVKKYMYVPTRAKYEFKGLLETMKRLGFLQILRRN